jgi:hypothetical protein
MKKYISAFFFFLSSFFFLLSPLSAYDFGLLINANGGFGNAVVEDNAFDFKVDILPRFSTLIGDNGELIISAGFSLEKEEEFFSVPELLRTEFSMRFDDSGIRVGRINYSDPLSFVANGLFDGIQYYYNSEMGNFRVSAFYTGFQYKKRANIVMSKDDQAAFFAPFDYGDFFNTYFASKRTFFSIGWEHPSIAELLHLNTSIIAQADLNSADSKYHNQYLILKASVPINNFLMEFGGSVELSQAVASDEDKFNVAFAGEIGLFLLFPSKFNSRLSLTGTIASGRTDDSIGAFIPITGKEFGYILKTRISGLSIFSLNYSSKFSNSLDGSFTASYFVRNDLGTFNSYPVTPVNEGYFLGPEATAQVTWSLASDLQFIFGCGAFFPSLGDVGPKEKTKWRVELSVIMSVL